MAGIQGRAELGVEIFNRQIIVASVPDPEYQCIAGFQDSAFS